MQERPHDKLFDCAFGDAKVRGDVPIRTIVDAVKEKRFPGALRE